MKVTWSWHCSRPWYKAVSQNPPFISSLHKDTETTITIKSLDSNTYYTTKHSSHAIQKPRCLQLRQTAHHPLLVSKIPNLSTLGHLIPSSIVVALDKEGVSKHINGHLIPNPAITEIDVAILLPTGNTPRFIPHMSQFHDGNGIEAFTLRIHERPYGPVVGLMTNVTQEDAGHHLQRFLAKFKGEQILLGYDMQAEFTWMTTHCPSLACTSQAGATCKN
jgi:hypothetical protein